MNFQFVKKSSNVKTGPIPTTNSPRATCPPACPLAGEGGCYAEAGYHTRLNWDKLDKGERGDTWQDFTAKISNLKAGQLWRHNVSGDLPGQNDVLDSDKCMDLMLANGSSRGFTYTHYPVDKGHNRHTIAAMNNGGFTVNLSANSPQHAEKLKADPMNFGLPVVSIVPGDFWGTDGKRKGQFVRCPAEYRDDVSCATCKLCSVRSRGDIVGFTVHGTRAKNADVIARG